MTYRLSRIDHAEPVWPAWSSLPTDEDLTPLLAPASLVPAHEIVRNKTLVPDVAGIYGWWFDTPLPGVPIERTLSIGSHRLLYVGIAPRKPSVAGRSSKSTLRKRITRNHLGNRLGSSTLRRSLAWLLREELSLVIATRGRKDFMSREHEAVLSEWIISHARVSFLPHSCAWDIEDKLIACGSPLLPLNLRGANHDFVFHLKKLRSSTIGTETPSPMQTEDR